MFSSRHVFDVPYREPADAEDDRNSLNVYAPSEGEGHPVMVFFYGGGLVEGRKTIAHPPADRMAEQGVVVLTPDYRLSPAVTYPAYIEDAAAAVAWAREHAADYGGDGDRLFIGGHSAGSYLAAMVAMDPRYLARHGLKPSILRGVWCLSGQMMTHFTVVSERGGNPKEVIVDEAAPIFHARHDAPPFLCQVGDNDIPGRGDQNREFRQAMLEAGHRRVIFEEVSDRDHGGILSAMDYGDDPALQQLLAFIREEC